MAPEAKLQSLLQDFSVAMLVTHTGQGQMRARPMALAEVEPNGTLWFLTSRRSGKMQELAKDGNVVVTMQTNTKFVSISGTAAPVENREKVAKVWNVGMKVWFPGGVEDPDLLLLKVESERGEYWDNSGTSGLKYLIEAGKALLTGTRPEVENDPKIHGKVKL